MTSIARPLFRLLTAEIETVVRECWSSPKILRFASEELGFRKKAYPQALKAEIDAHLSSHYFKWPETVAVGGGCAGVDGDDWPQRSPLHVLGYSAATQGPPTEQRRDTLARAFLGNLPNVFDAAYMTEWGQPRTSARLRRMANHLAANCRNAKRRDLRANKNAIEKWEDDLEWLRVNFYVGKFDFQWPPST